MKVTLLKVGFKIVGSKTIKLSQGLAQIDQLRDKRGVLLCEK